MALKMLRDQRIQLLGSDCHNLTTRKPQMAAAVDTIRQHLGGDMLGRIQACQDLALSEPQVD